MTSITVVIPVYNRELVISDAINSVLGQTSTVDEIIVVDDGSTDGTIDRLHAFAGKVRILRQSNQGPSAARNAGIRASRSKWIAFLDSDDLWYPEKLELQKRHIEKMNDMGCIHTRYVVQGQDFRELSPNPPLMQQLRLEDLLIRNRIGTSTVLARREILTALGGFDENLRIVQDWDLWLRMAQERVKFGYVSRPLVSYRLSGENLVADLSLAEKETLAVVSRHLSSGQDSEKNYGLREKAIASAQLRFARQRLSVGNRNLAWHWLRQAIRARPLAALAGEAAQVFLGLLIGKRPYEFARRVRRYYLEREVRTHTIDGVSSRP